MTLSQQEYEKDTDLKLRTMRYLWNLGYYVRKNVPLTEAWAIAEPVGGPFGQGRKWIGTKDAALIGGLPIAFGNAHFSPLAWDLA